MQTCALAVIDSCGGIPKIVRGTVFPGAHNQHRILCSAGTMPQSACCTVQAVSPTCMCNRASGFQEERSCRFYNRGISLPCGPRNSSSNVYSFIFATKSRCISVIAFLSFIIATALLFQNARRLPQDSMPHRLLLHAEQASR